QEVQINQRGFENDVTPLYLACQLGLKDIAALLIDYNADPYLDRIDDGTTPLFIAITQQHFDVVDMLLSRGIDPNRKNMTNGNLALHYPTTPQITQLLLRHGSQVN